MLCKWFNPLTKLEKMMTDLSDAVASVQSSVTKLSTDMSKAFADLQAAIASGNQADIDAAVAALGTINTTLQGMDTAALAADPVPAAPSA